MPESINDAFDTLYRTEYIGIPTNPHWRENIHRWRYLVDSFNGGNEYRRGEYLTKYTLEDPGEYRQRIHNTALDNHCKSVIDTYNAFLFRKAPIRTYGTIESDPSLDAFLEDCDLEGRSFDAFMRDVSTQASIYGHTWIIVDKPQTQVGTRAEELQQEIRPYVSMVTPEHVIDWEYERLPNGYQQLSRIMIVENIYDHEAVVREYTRDTIRILKYVADQSPQIVTEMPNALGVVPCVPVYAQRSVFKGVGVSDISDIADVQRSIYNELSELEQVIRLSNHPSLVISPGTDTSAGAGAVITMDANQDPGLKPYLLQPTGASIEALLKSMESKVDSINRMANMGGVRNTVTRAMSGIALETEFQLLNARLSSKADHLELGEEHIWRLWAQWQGQTWTGTVDYPDSFNIHDKNNVVTLVQEAKKSNPQNSALLVELDKMLARALVHDEDDLAAVLKDQNEQVSVVEQPGDVAPQVTTDEMQHPAQTTASGLVDHLRTMIQEGYTDQQILDLHPELRKIEE